MNKKQLYGIGLVLVLGGLLVYSCLSIRQADEIVQVDSPYDMLVISEVVSRNQSICMDEDGDYSDYVELYNGSDTTLALGGIGLSDDAKEPYKWVFPERSLAPGSYLIIFASDKDRKGEELHTNFKLSSQGDNVFLVHPSGERLQTLAVDPMNSDMSFERTVEGNYEYYAFGTPGEGVVGAAITDLAEYRKGYCVEFSVEAGFYAEKQELSLSVPSDKSVIRYTMDGSDPTVDSAIYMEPLVIDRRDAESAEYALIPSSYWEYSPPDPEGIYQGTVVKAQAFLENVPVGEVVTNSYFIADQGGSRYSLPVVSITTDPANFFDDEIGIYVVGSQFEEMAPANRDGSTPANYNQRGREWERPVHMEYFEDGQLLFEQSLGIRTMGGWSRANPKKSFKLYARNCYQEGARSLEYSFFDGLIAEDGTAIDSFERIALRSGGNDWDIALLRDPLMLSLVEDTSLDTQATKPVIMFLDGEYWGIYYLYECLDQHYLADHYGVEEEDIVILTPEESVLLDYGEDSDRTHYEDMISFLSTKDMSMPANYAYISTLIDINNLIDYYVSQIYYCNTDWPGNNVKVWRKRTDGYQPDAPYGQDGRYRYLLYDTDFGFSLYPDMSNPQHQTIAFAAQEGSWEWPNPDWSTLIFRKLLDNAEFKNKFITCMVDYLNTIFEPTVVKTKLDAMVAQLAPEIDEYSGRYYFSDEVNWKTYELSRMYSFAEERPDSLRSQIQSYFGITSTYRLSISANQDGGSIEMNDHGSVISDGKMYYEGIYFSDIPVTIEAKVKDGYQFVGWEGVVTSGDARITLTLSEDASLQAVYIKQE